MLPIPSELLDADLTDPVTNRKIQMALLRRLDLAPDVLETLDKAMTLYYEENEPLPEAPENAQTN